MSDDALLKQIGDAARQQEAEERALRAQNPELFLPEGSAGVTLHPRSPWKLFGPIGGLAAAAAALWWFLQSPAPPLPEYVLELRSGGLIATRTATIPEGPVRLTQGLRLELLARPATRVEGRVEAKLYLVEGDRWISSEAKIETDAAGTIRVVGYVGSEIPLPKGEATLTLVVGRELPEAAAAPPAAPGMRVTALSVTAQP